MQEESLDSVRVLSIHKAKGLEFPVVVLPGLHQQSASFDRHAEVTADWMSGVYGCSFPPTWNAGQVLLWEKERIREKAEQRRVFYVGMTRARDRLMLSGGLLKRSIGESFLGFLQEVVDGEVGNPEYKILHVGSTAIRQRVLMSHDVPVSRKVVRPDPPEMTERKDENVLTLEQASEREAVCQQVSQHVAFSTPSMLHTSPVRRTMSGPRADTVIASQTFGTLVHQVLEQWDFQLDFDTFREPLRTLLDKGKHEDLQPDDMNSVVLDIEQLMEMFLQSPAYRELQQATIIGREIPFIMPWSEQKQVEVGAPSCVMEGVMDVVYEVAGELWVGDYKTDRVADSHVIGYADAYRQQAQVYANAAARSLGLNVRGCKLIFLRIGEVVTMTRDGAIFP